MTTVSTPRVDTPTTAAPPRLAFAGVLRSELDKLGSLRSTRVAALCVPLLVVAGTLLKAFVFAHTLGPVPVHLPARAVWSDVLAGGTDAGELAGAVLAALAVGSGWTGRTALTTFVAVPRRLLVLAAQVVALLVPLAVLVALGLVVGAALSLPLVAPTVLGGPWTGAVGAGLAGLVTVLACAFLALAVTTLVRSTAGGVTITLAVLLVLPVVLPLVDQALGVDLAPSLLTYAAPMAAALHDPDGPGALVRDVVVTVAWLVVPGVAAASVLVRRDA